jgi:hypothetical protein
MSHFAPLVEEGMKVDLACHLEINAWNGAMYLQLRLLDLKPAS